MGVGEALLAPRMLKNSFSFEYLKPSKIAGGNIESGCRMRTQRQTVEQDMGALDARVGEQALALDVVADRFRGNGALVEADGDVDLRLKDAFTEAKRDVTVRAGNLPCAKAD